METNPTPIDSDILPISAAEADNGLERDNRVIVFGSNMSGAAELVGAIRDELEQNGASDEVDVYQSRRAEFIEDSFYGRTRRFGLQQAAEAQASQPRAAELTGATPKRGLIGKLRALGKSGVQTEIEAPTVAPAQTVHEAAPDMGATLPKGVIMLPEMRTYYEYGMTVPTPYEEIEALCEANGVPFVRLEAVNTPDEIRQAASFLNPGPEQV